MFCVYNTFLVIKEGKIMLQALVLVLQGGTPAQVRDVDAYTSTAILLAHTGNLEDRTDNSLFGVPGRHIVFHVVRILRPARMIPIVCNGPNVRKYVLVFGGTTPTEVFHQVGFDPIRATGTTAGTAAGTSGQHTLHVINVEEVGVRLTQIPEPDIRDLFRGTVSRNGNHLDSPFCPSHSLIHFIGIIIIFIIAKHDSMTCTLVGILQGLASLQTGHTNGEHRSTLTGVVASRFSRRNSHKGGTIITRIGGILQHHNIASVSVIASGVPGIAN